MMEEQDAPETMSVEQAYLTAFDRGAHGRYQDAVGTVFGDVGTNTFKFAVTGNIERSDYVVVEHPDCGDVLCQVGSIVRKTTMTLEKAVEAASNDRSKDRVVATVDVIGFKDRNGILQITRTTFLAGTSVRRSGPEFIRKILGLRDDLERVFITVLLESLKGEPGPGDLPYFVVVVLVLGTFYHA